MGGGGELVVKSREDESEAVSMRQPRECIAAKKYSKRRRRYAAAGRGEEREFRLGCSSEKKCWGLLLVCAFKDERKGVSTHRTLPVAYLFHQTNRPGMESRANNAMSGGRGVMKWNELWAAPGNLWVTTTS